jgi:hypothetical protein
MREATASRIPLGAMIAGLLLAAVGCTGSAVRDNRGPPGVQTPSAAMTDQPGAGAGNAGGGSGGNGGGAHGGHER